ncbi:MAG: AAA family ATPase [Fimbriimonas sp.]
MIGLPAAGKSSFYRERFASTHAHISKDNFPSSRRPAKTQERLLREALEAGKDVVIDNTNAAPEERAAILTVAAEFGARTVAYGFPGTVTDCRERNAQREGKANVPLVALYATAKRLRFPKPDERFTERYRVDLLDGGFVVRPWQDDDPERV